MGNTVFMFDGVWYNSHSFGRKFGINPATIRGRLDRGWPPERLLEPVDETKSSRKPAPKEKPKEKREIKKLDPKAVQAMKGYSDYDLFQLYRRFSDEPDALRRLADFMASDTDTAMKKVIQWQKEGRIEMGKMSREKGKAGEAGDVEGLPGIHVEVKRKEKFNLYEALEQAQRDAAAGGRGMPIVAHRRNGKPWVIVMAAEDWFRLYTAAVEGL